MVRSIRHKGIVHKGLLPLSVALKNAHAVMNILFEDFLQLDRLSPDYRLCRVCGRHFHPAGEKSVSLESGEIQFKGETASHDKRFGEGYVNPVGFQAVNLQVHRQNPVTIPTHRHQERPCLRRFSCHLKGLRPATVLCRSNPSRQRNPVPKA